MTKIIFSVILTALVINVLILNYWVLNTQSFQQDPSQLVKVETLENNNSEQNSHENVSQDTCSDACLTYINEVLENKEDDSVINTQNSTNILETYIPLGSGSSFASDWEDITGLEASIDTTKYKNISKVTFELTMLIPNGNQEASVRLYNKTDKHPVWFSEVSHSGGEAKAIISNPIQLDSGNKTYIVQAKTQLQNEVKIINARIKILNE